VEGIGQDKIPGALDLRVIDDYITVSDRDAFTMARRLTREEGLVVGGSAGLIAHAALSVARRINDPDACVVTVLCDTGERYLSKVFNDEWLRENQLLDPEKVTLGQLLGAKTGTQPTLVSTAPGASVRQALGLMSLHDVSQLPVMDGANCVGSVAESVLSVRGLEDTKVLERSVADVMDAPFPIVDAGMPADAAVKLLGRNNSAVLVREGSTIQGILTRSDLLQFLMAR
jgi:cystathionine beta-synthase